jgi:alpha-L-glutamate ligase-like protein
MPDVRVICQDGRPVAAMLRLPTQASGGRANLHQGGVGAAVDLATGRVVAARWRRRPILHHPDTGAELVGLQIPAWSSVLETSAACADATGLGYLGADVVFDRTLGHLVLEVNARPGLEIQNVQGRGLAGDLTGVERPEPVPTLPQPRPSSDALAAAGAATAFPRPAVS